MSEYEQIESFRKNGFVMIPDVITREEVQQFRDLMYAITETMPADKRVLTIADTFHDQRLLDALLRFQFNDKLISTISKIVNGKVVYVNDITVQCNMFGLGEGGGWHRDSGSEVCTVTNRYLYEPDYTFGKVGIYLQDNTAEFGGGISVIPRSHKAFRFFRGSSLAQQGYRSAMNRISLFNARRFGRELLVPIRAGAAVYFDSRLLHHSTDAKSLPLDPSDKSNCRRVSNDVIGRDHAKYVFYWDACAVHNSGQFLDHLGKRAITEEVSISKRTGVEAVYSEQLSYYYPNDYPERYVNRAQQTNAVSIASLDKHTADLWKKVRDSFL